MNLPYKGIELSIGIMADAPPRGEPAGPIDSQTSMRRVFVPLLALLSASAFSQGIPPDEAVIRPELATLATFPAIFLDLFGADTMAGKATGFEYRAYMQNTVQIVNGNTRVITEINITEYNGSGSAAQPMMSLIGDGVTLWRYDYVNNTYAATDYGTYSGPQPPDYTGTLFRDLTSLSDGYMSFVIQFLKQTYEISGVMYQSWMPGVAASIDQYNSVTYSIGTPPRRTITFNNLQTGALKEVDYTDSTTVRGIARSTNWRMPIQSLTATDPNMYKFTPPLGARAIALPHLSGH